MSVSAARQLEANDLGALYANALMAFCKTGDRGSLASAYEIALAAHNERVGLVALHEVHQAAIAFLRKQYLEEANHFFHEVLAHYENALRGPQITALGRHFDQELCEANCSLQRERDDLDGLIAQRTGELLEQYEEMKRLNKQLAQTNQEQAEFTYAISHDLMSPLNTINMMLSFLEEDLLNEADAHVLEPLDAARTTATRMLNIVEDTLRYSRTIGQDITYEAVDLADLVQDILSDLQGDLEHKRAAVQIGALPKINGVKVQLRVLFQNLLCNALKFRHPGRTPIIRISAQHWPDHVDISVADNGIGIEEKHHDRIFGLFQRLHTFEEYKGTGLGLTLCKRIAGNHGGEISVSSRPDAGTTFVTTLKTPCLN